jgi:NADPH2:quinone reductase
MTKTISIQTHGGTELLQMKSGDLKKPGKGEVLISHTAIGINFIDIDFRKGIYNCHLPYVPGIEACGYVEEIGEGVEGINIGDRYAYATARGGAYSEQRIIKADKLVAVPDYISDEEAAASLLKGMMAHLLLRRTFYVKPGDKILVHAAAGGLGSLLCQYAYHLKATVIGTVGSQEKAEYAKAYCHHVINYREQDFVKQVYDITAGQGVSVVFDSVGNDTFNKSLDCLVKFGLMVSYGQSSGQVPLFEPALLRKNSLFLTYPSIYDYKHNRMELILSADEVWNLIKNQIIKSNIYRKYSLEEAALAHQAIEERQTIGSSIFVL